MTDLFINITKVILFENLLLILFSFFKEGLFRRNKTSYFNNKMQSLF